MRTVAVCLPSISFSSLGFYPVSPGIPMYAIGSPLFERSEIRLANGKVFTVIAHGASWENKYIQSAKLNGVEYDKTWFTHENIMEGGTLELLMGNRPNKGWGIGEGQPLLLVNLLIDSLYKKILFMLVSLREIVADAYQNGYAVGAFNCLSLENVEGAIMAAEELNSPIILQLAEVQFPLCSIRENDTDVCGCGSQFFCSCRCSSRPWIKFQYLCAGDSLRGYICHD